MKISRAAWILGVVAAVLFLNLAQAFAEISPKDRVQKVMAEALSVIGNNVLDEESKRQAVKRIGLSFLNVEKISQRSLGKYWELQTPENQKKFVTLFTDFLERLYLNNVLNLKSVEVTDERLEGPLVMVDMRVTMKKQEKDMTMTIFLSNEKGEWRAYDILVDNDSLVGTYRKQFHRLLGFSTFEELLKKMEGQINDLKKN